MALLDQNHVMYAGESKVFTCTHRDEDTDALISLAGATGTWTLVDDLGAVVLTKTTASGITVTGTGTYTITLTPANTSSLKGRYSHQMVWVLADTSDQLAFTGYLQIKGRIA